MLRLTCGLRRLRRHHHCGRRRHHCDRHRHRSHRHHRCSHRRCSCRHYRKRKNCCVKIHRVSSCRKSSWKKNRFRGNSCLHCFWKNCYRVNMYFLRSHRCGRMNFRHGCSCLNHDYSCRFLKVRMTAVRFGYSRLH